MGQGMFHCVKGHLHALMLL